MILADTSAWVEYDRATGSAVDRRLTALIRNEGPLAVTEPVIMEVVAGRAPANASPSSGGCCCDSVCWASTSLPTSTRRPASTVAAGESA